MVDGLTTFSEGLFEATLQRGERNNLPPSEAVRVEINEINSFIEALKSKYGVTVETSKKMAEMIFGIAVFSGALFDSALNGGDSEGSNDLKDQYRQRVKTVGLFLERLEEIHQALRKTHPSHETMTKAVQWIDENDK